MAAVDSAIDSSAERKITRFIESPFKFIGIVLDESDRFFGEPTIHRMMPRAVGLVRATQPFADVRWSRREPIRFSGIALGRTSRAETAWQGHTSNQRFLIESAEC